MADHVNKNFLNKFLGKSVPADPRVSVSDFNKQKLLEEKKKRQEELETANKSKYIQEFYLFKNTPKQRTLNPMQAEVLNESLARHFSRLSKNK